MAYSKLAKKKLLELADLINEDITSGRAIVYHRTGKKGSPIEGIATDGFRVGSGAAYGIGVYTTYDLESQLSGKMEQYGKIIIESKIKTLDKFLIFDYDVAKRIYGSKYTLENQLKLILKKDWNQYNNNQDLKNILEKISVVKYTSEVAMNLYLSFPEIISKLRGIIFTGSNDGKVCVSYDRTNIEPLKYTLDEGKTWKNIIDKNIYQRIKKQNTEDETELQHLINKLDIGKDISDDEIKKILGNKIKISLLGKNALRQIFRRISDQEKDQFIDLILKYKKNDLDPDFFSFLLANSKNKKYLTDKFDFEFLKNQNYESLYEISNIYPEDDRYKVILLEKNIPQPSNINISYVYNNIIKNAVDINLIYNKLKEFNHLKKIGGGSNIRTLIDRFENKDDIIDDIIENLGTSLPAEYLLYFISSYSNTELLLQKIPEELPNKISSSSIGSLLDAQILLKQKENTDKIINFLLKNKKNLYAQDVYYFLLYHSDLDYVAKVLGEENINKLTGVYVGKLLLNIKDTDKISYIIGQENINKLNKNDVYSLLNEMLKSRDSLDVNKIINSIGLENIEKLDGDQTFSIMKNIPKEEDSLKYNIIIYAVGHKNIDKIFNIGAFLDIDMKNKNNFFRDIILKYKKNLISNNVYDLLKNKINRQETLELLGSNIKKLDVYDIKRMFSEDYYFSKNELIDILLKYKKDDLTKEIVYLILNYSENIYDSANKMGEQNIDKLSDPEISKLLNQAKDPIIMANILGKKNIKKLSEINISNLLSSAKPKETINLLSNIILNNLKGDLSANSITYVIRGSDDKNKNEIIDKILEFKKNDLDENLMIRLFSYSSDKENLIKKILNIKGESLTQEDIVLLISQSNNTDEIIKLIGREKIDNLNPENIASFFMLRNFGIDTNKIANSLGRKNIEKIDESGIFKIIYSYRHMMGATNDKIFLEKLIQNLNIIGKDKISNLKDESIADILGDTLQINGSNSVAFDNIKKLFLNYISKERMGNIINKFNLKENKNISNVRKKIRNILKEETFRLHDLDYDNQSDIYDIFKQSYEKSVGTSWEKDKFFGRSSNWLFFGDKEGFVAVRPQNSGFYKLVGVAGKLKSIIKGVEELQATGKPIWGMVTDDIKKMALKKGFKTPPAFLIKFLLKMIPKSVFGNTDFIINSDGSITLNYSDVGPSKKYFIANDEYFRKLKNDSWSQISDKLSTLPIIVQKGIKSFLAESEVINEQNNIRKFVKQIIKDIY